MPKIVHVDLVLEHEITNTGNGSHDLWHLYNERRAGRMALHWHALWDELFNMDDPRDQLPAWMEKVVQAGGNCGCMAFLEKHMEEHSPSFDDWFRWCFNLKNAVNLKLDKPLLGYLDALSERERGSNHPDGFIHMVQPVIREPVIDPTSSRAVITVAPDAKSQAELAITGERMRVYAANQGCDFIAITKLSKQRYVAANKYAYSEIAARYDQSLWLDTDVVVDPNAPSIFDSVPIGAWGMVDDLVFMEDTQWFVKEWSDMQRAWGVPQSRVPRAWNSGVVVAPRDAARCYYPTPMRVPNVWCAEQHWHTQCLLANDAHVVDLPTVWNNGYPWRAWPNQLASSWFNHVNGCRPQSLRLRILQHLANGNTDFPESLYPDGNDWKPSWISEALSSRANSSDLP